LGDPQLTDNGSADDTGAECSSGCRRPAASCQWGCRRRARRGGGGVFGVGGGLAPRTLYVLTDGGSKQHTVAAKPPAIPDCRCMERGQPQLLARALAVMHRPVNPSHCIGSMCGGQPLSCPPSLLHPFPNAIPTCCSAQPLSWAPPPRSLPSPPFPKRHGKHALNCCVAFPPLSPRRAPAHPSSGQRPPQQLCTQLP
jgi:hypothetical protein